MSLSQLQNAPNVEPSSCPDESAPCARPFLKWAGGKKQLLRQILPAFPKTYGRYFEPFVGGGAVFFALAPQAASLNDINPNLIGTYRSIQRHVEQVIAGLASLKNDQDTYYCLRAMDPPSLSPAARAARFIYINRTCYNGLYRVNQSGGFNVPFGRYLRPTICDADNLRAVAARLRHTQLSSGSFERSLRSVQTGDLVYFDPPYVPISKTANFVQYAKGGFDMTRQLRLATLARTLADRGAHVVLSNADTPAVRRLYKGFRQTTVLARRSINCQGASRGHVAELLIASS